MWLTRKGKVFQMSTKRRVFFGVVMFFTFYMLLSYGESPAATYPANDQWGNTYEVQYCSGGQGLPWKFGAAVVARTQFSKDSELGWLGFAKATSGSWSEAYVGPLYKSKNGMFEVSPCIGFEASKAKTRYALAMAFKRGPFNLSHTWEGGQITATAPGHWQKTVLTCKIRNYGRVGVWKQRRLGFGPRIDIQMPRTARLYAAVLFDGPVTRPAVGVTTEF